MMLSLRFQRFSPSPSRPRATVSSLFLNGGIHFFKKANRMDVNIFCINSGNAKDGWNIFVFGGSKNVKSYPQRLQGKDLFLGKNVRD